MSWHAHDPADIGGRLRDSRRTRRRCCRASEESALDREGCSDRVRASVFRMANVAYSRSASTNELPIDRDRWAQRAGVRDQTKAKECALKRRGIGDPSPCCSGCLPLQRAGTPSPAKRSARLFPVGNPRSPKSTGNGAASPLQPACRYQARRFFRRCPLCGDWGSGRPHAHCHRLSSQIHRAAIAVGGARMRDQ